MIRRLLTMALVFAATSALAHDWYGSLTQPNSKVSCCNKRDCRPAPHAYMDDDGVWHAWVNDQLVPVPASTILEGVVAPDGNSHICANKDGKIFCFIRGLPKG